MVVLSTVRQALGKLLNALTLMAFGALLLSWYVENTFTALPQDWNKLRDSLTMICCSLGFISNLLTLQGDKDEQGASKEPSPRWNGLGVVVATGLAAIWAVHGRLEAKSEVLADIAIVSFMVLAAIAIWRFATIHGVDIGEARFTTNPPKAPQAETP